MTSGKPKMIEVKLLGELGRKFGRSYRFVARSTRDVISALSNQLDGFAEYMATAHERGIGFKVVTREPDGIDYSELAVDCDRVVIAPVITGGNNFVKILLGVALIALSFVTLGAATGAFAGLAAAGASGAVGSAALFATGIGLVLGGVAGLLSPGMGSISTPSIGSIVTRGGPSRPKGEEGGGKRDSFLFDRAAQLTNQGLPIPLLYGEYLVTSSLALSSAVNVEALNTSNSPNSEADE